MHTPETNTVSVLMMVYNTRNVWVSGLPAIVRYSKEHNVSETGPVSVLKVTGLEISALFSPFSIKTI
jgi:hypothetical protein